MRIAALQTDIVWEDRESNFARIAPWLTAASAAGARLVVLPEMFSYGFSMNTERIAEPPDGRSTAFLREQAHRRGFWIAGSLPERPPSSTKPFNTLVLAGPDGELHRYRKIHPFSFAGEDRHYAAGDSSLTVEIEGLRLTLFVCYDLRFADEFWITAEVTDAYLVCANWPERRRLHWVKLLDARAIENQAYVIGVNRVGAGGDLTYVGDSRIVDPWGEVLAAAAGGETMLLAEIDPGLVREARQRFPLFGDRRRVLA